MSIVTSYQIPSHALCSRISPLTSSSSTSSPPPPLVAFGCSDRSVHIMRFGDGHLVTKLEGSATPVTAVTFDKELERVVGGCDDGGVRVWDIKSSASIRTLGNSHKDAIAYVDFHPFGDFVATASRDTCLRIWDMRRRSSLQSYKGTPAELTVCKFAPSGKWVVSGCAQGILRLYDLANGKELNRFEAHSGPITSVAFHPEQFLMAATSEDGTWSLWNLESQTKVYQSNVNLMPSAYTNAQFMRRGLVAANQRVLRGYSFSAMGDSKAKSIATLWDGVNDMLYSQASEEALAVECRGTSVNFFRVPCAPFLSQGTSTPPPQNVQLSTPTVNRAAAPHTPTGNEADADNRRNPYQPNRVVREPIAHASTPNDEDTHTNNMMGRRKGMRRTSNSDSEYDTPPPNERISNLLPRVNSAKRAAIPIVPPVTAAAGNGNGVEGSDAAVMGATSDEAVLENLDKTSVAMGSVLGRRVTHLRVCRQMWPDIRGVMAHLSRVLQDGSDGGVVTDFLNAMQHQRVKERVTIEVLPEALALVAMVMTTQKMEVPLLSAIKIARSLNNKFRQRIDDALKGAAFQHNGVDISMEARVALSRKAQTGFDEIFFCIAPFVKRTDSIGEEARGLLQELPRPAR